VTPPYPALCLLLVCCVPAPCSCGDSAGRGDVQGTAVRAPSCIGAAAGREGEWGRAVWPAACDRPPTSLLLVEACLTRLMLLPSSLLHTTPPQALDALAHLHARGISGCSGLGLHSLLLTASCDVKLFGFAAAAAGGDGGGGGPLVGRPRTPDDDGVAAGARWATLACSAAHLSTTLALRPHCVTAP
jgi:hypothetical protein